MANMTLPNNTVQKIASDLAVDIVQYSCRVDVSPKDKCTQTMRRCVDGMLTDYQYKFNGLMKLVNDDTDIAAFLHGVVKHMLEEGPLNWGRIIAIYAITARMAQHLVTKSPNNKDSIIKAMAEFWSSAVGRELGKWITEQGGFDSFVQNFGNENKRESAVFKGVVAVTATLGLCAMAYKVFH